MTTAPGPTPARGDDPIDMFDEFKRKESCLLWRMSRRSMETARLLQEVGEAKAGANDSQADSLRDALVDPAANLEIAMLRRQLQEKSDELERLREEAQSRSARELFQHSLQGQKLYTKCAHLMEENAELARQLGEEHLQKMRIQMTIERTKRLQLRRRLLEFEQHAEQVDGENERMQNKIKELGQSLKATRAEIESVHADVAKWAHGGGEKRKHESAVKERSSKARCAEPASTPMGATVFAPLTENASRAGSEKSGSASVRREKKKKEKKGKKEKKEKKEKESKKNKRSKRSKE